MIERSIAIFFDREEVSTMEKIRSIYDPLFEKIPPHITLVFPFESSLSTEECITHLKESLFGSTPFKLTLNETMVADDGCLYVLIDFGKSEVEQLHDRLYSGILSRYQSDGHVYVPHVTIGRFADRQKAVAVQKTIGQQIPTMKLAVQSIIVELIKEDEHSKIEYVHDFDSDS
ncbi:2'-5' RNA ligase family protein [Pseudalkalibacillus sp. R45]|uniref:2'-5' RNA ligase family protein n=1 Tax=Pseudalkalibacillus sp. R45 TaxID=3457433 RepID=UPI003FCDC130